MREARDEGLVALRSKYRVCLAWIINAVIHINEINIHKILDISSSLFGSRVTTNKTLFFYFTPEVFHKEVTNCDDGTGYGRAYSF